ncbi:GNAT family N-acetyltransferase [Mucilaginibacter sp.]|uniref:GNAT family N-acetyltransferase n=1 Tax=Mucilaginibacter sp. TaxID=1882438 RepID=UPI0035BBC8DF
MDLQGLQVTNNESIHNFEMFVDGERAFIDYKTKDGKMYLVHTEVPTELQGQGVAEVMVEKTFKYLEENNLKLVPLCSYIQSYLKRHPEWERLLA